LLAPVQLGVHQDPLALFRQAAFQWDGSQHLLVHVIVHPWVQDFALLLVDLHEVPVDPFLQPVEVSLDSIMTLWRISSFSSFCVVCKLAEGTRFPTIQIINEDVKQDWTQYGPLGYTTSHWPATRLCDTDHHFVGPAIQPVFNPLHCTHLTHTSPACL